jgi:hypothetical protein
MLLWLGGLVVSVGGHDVMVDSGCVDEVCMDVGG